MSGKRILTSVLLLMLLLTTGKVMGQTADKRSSFEGIKSRGTIPADMRKDLEQLYSEDKQRVRDYSDKIVVSNRDKVLNASFHINRLMASGKILYGDPITEMLNKVADTLLSDYPELRKELRIYSVKSSEVNAFTTGQGIVLVNLGLVAQVENEAQLAFVLSHEIVHYVRKHSLEIMSRKERTSSNKEKELTNFLRRHSRSREMENEADSLGIAMFYGKSPYSKRVTEGFFDVLQYGYLPFDEIEFDTLQFNGPYFKVSKGSFLTSVTPISAREDYIDTLSTHPNLQKRRLATSRQMSGMTGGADYVVTDRKGFEELQTLARMECIRQDIIHAEYASSYYNSYVLLRQQPDNEYYKMAKAQSLYGASKYRSYAATSSTSNYRNKEGEIQQAYHYMLRSKPEELCITAIREIWKIHQELPSEQRLEEMMTDLMSDLGRKYGYKADMFSATMDTASSRDTIETRQNQKYSNVNRRRKRQEFRNSMRYAFLDIIEKDSKFYETLSRSLTKSESEEREESGKGVFIYAPTYLSVNVEKEELNIFKSERGEQTLVECLKANNEANGMKSVDFSDGAMRTNESEDYYNDFVSLNEWVNEFWQSNGTVPMKYSTQPLMEKLMERYDADKIQLGVVVNTEKNKSTTGPLFTIIGACFVLPIPELIYHHVTCHQQSVVENKMIDTRNGKVINSERSTTEGLLTKADVQSLTYAVTTDKKVPGYMGRKVIVSAEGGLSFPILNKVFRDKTDNFALRYGGGIEIVVGTKSSLAANIDFGKTTFDINTSSGIGYDYNTNSGTIEASIMTAKLNYRSYTGDYVAPQGTYYGIGLSMSKVDWEPTDPSAVIYNLRPSYTRFGLNIEFGRNRILFDRLVLSYGARYNFTLANPVEKIDEGFYLDNTTSRVNTERAFNANLWMYNLLSLHLGIGFMPF